MARNRWGIALVFVALVGAGCGRLFKGGGAITVAKVRAETAAPQVTVAGQLVPSDRAEIKFPREVKLDQMLVAEGARINPGDPLFTLSQSELTSRLTQVRAALKEAEALLERNSFLLKNRERLASEGKMDATQQAGIEGEVRANEATVERNRADLAALEAEVGATSVVSPIAGLVHQRLVPAGATVAENQPTVVIVRIDPIFVWFRLTADEAPGIGPGTGLRVRIEELPGTTLAATVHHISPELNQPGKTFDVWASIPNTDETLKIGMRAFAEFTTVKQHQVYVVPASAIILREGEPYIFKVQQGIARFTKVTVKGRSATEVILVDGVGPEDLVVVRGQQSLQDGMMVDVWR
ncbi:MAG: efflux RND transporter periplasmic adaptor subunit [Deltaproteobacteria bacterium]|nr:efflux RND transporter periplasmic adaptor subunit [Deltaproteobacteria bacterium]